MAFERGRQISGVQTALSRTEPHTEKAYRLVAALQCLHAERARHEKPSRLDDVETHVRHAIHFWEQAEEFSGGNSNAVRGKVFG